MSDLPLHATSIAADAVIRCDSLEMGPDVVIEEGVRLEGGLIQLGRGTRIRSGTTIRVREEFTVGPGSVCGPVALIEGRSIRIGRELWTGPQVRIGGGSCFEIHSALIAGYWLHLGMRTFVNTARPVYIGNEVGIGTGSAIYTHGAYQSPLAGFPVSFAPVSIGDNCWLPGAIVNPGVTIGANTVIAVGSVVNRSIPAGSLAGGIPCRVIKENSFPRSVTTEERRRFLTEFLRTATEILVDCKLTPVACILSEDATQLRVNDTTFDLNARIVSGPADACTEKVRDLLRRHGIRFFTEVVGDMYQDWRQNV